MEIFFPKLELGHRYSKVGCLGRLRTSSESQKFGSCQRSLIKARRYDFLYETLQVVFSKIKGIYFPLIPDYDCGGRCYDRGIYLLRSRVVDSK